MNLEMITADNADIQCADQKHLTSVEAKLDSHAKCRPNIANSAPHTPNPLGTRSKLL
jgi:hypothetical protein